MTAIGLFLGGIGGGLTGQGNPAMDFLNKQIDRDIEAQKADLGNKKTLLEANLRQFGNLRDATDMTRIQQTEIYKSQLAKAAMATGNPLIQARANAQINQWDLQNASLQQQMTQNQLLYGGASTTQIPAAVDPNFESRIETGGGTFHAPNKETADKVRPQLQALDDLAEAAGEVDRFNKKNGTTAPFGTQAAGEAKGLQQRMAAAIAKVEASGGNIGRLVDKFKEMAPTPGAFMQSEQQGKSKNIHQFIADERAALIKNNLSSGLIPQKRK